MFCPERSAFAGPLTDVNIPCKCSPIGRAPAPCVREGMAIDSLCRFLVVGEHRLFDHAFLLIVGIEQKGELGGLG